MIVGGNFNYHHPAGVQISSIFLKKIIFDHLLLFFVNVYSIVSNAVFRSFRLRTELALSDDFSGHDCKCWKIIFLTLSNRSVHSNYFSYATFLVSRTEVRVCISLIYKPFIFGFLFKTWGNFQPGKNVPTGSQNNKNWILRPKLKRLPSCKPCYEHCWFLWKQRSLHQLCRRYILSNV